MTSLLDVLAGSATRASHRAVAHYVAGEFEDFYLQAGIAIEAAMKARLVREDPAFIAPSGSEWFRHAVALLQARDDISRLPSATKTVGAAEALGRITALEAGLSRLKPGIDLVLSGRNSHAHIGWHAAEDHQEAFVGFVRALDAFLRVPPEQYWAGYLDLVKAATDESMAGVRLRVEERLAAARDRYHQRFDALTEDMKDAFLSGVETNVDRQSWDELLPIACPACGSPALLEGTNRLDAEPDDWDRETGEPVHARAWLMFEGTSLSCEACGLVLSGGDELEAAGIKTVFENEDADVDEYMAQQAERDREAFGY